MLRHHWLALGLCSALIGCTAAHSETSPKKVRWRDYQLAAIAVALAAAGGGSVGWFAVQSGMLDAARLPGGPSLAWSELEDADWQTIDIRYGNPRLPSANAIEAICSAEEQRPTIETNWNRLGTASHLQREPSLGAPFMFDASDRDPVQMGKRDTEWVLGAVEVTASAELMDQIGLGRQSRLITLSPLTIEANDAARRDLAQRHALHRRGTRTCPLHDEVLQDWAQQASGAQQVNNSGISELSFSPQGGQDRHQPAILVWVQPEDEVESVFGPPGAVIVLELSVNTAKGRAFPTRLTAANFALPPGPDMTGARSPHPNGIRILTLVPPEGD